MPNHIRNVIKVLSGDASLLFSQLATSDRAVDFNSLVPKPPEIAKIGNVFDMNDNLAKVVMGFTPLVERPGDLIAALQQSNVIRALSTGPFLKDARDEVFNNFIDCLLALRATGFATWHDWGREKWGTKWNAYSIQVDDDTARFDTAWACPMPIYEAMADKFPDHILSVAYADEDFGSNCGRFMISGGEVCELVQPEYGPDSHRLAASVLYPDGLPSDMYWGNDGLAHYKDED